MTAYWNDNTKTMTMLSLFSFWMLTIQGVAGFAPLSLLHQQLPSRSSFMGHDSPISIVNVNSHPYHYNSPRFSHHHHHHHHHQRRSQLTTTMMVKPSASKVQIALQSNNVFRGRIMLVVHKLLVSPAKYKAIIVDRILPNTYWPEVALIVAMVNAEQLSQFSYRKRKQHLYTHTVVADNDTETTTVVVDQALLQKAFRRSKSFLLGRILRQVGLLQATLYVSDVTLAILKLLGFQFVVKYQAQHVAGSCILSLWSALNVSRLKYYYLKHGGGGGGMLSLKKLQQQRQLQRRHEEELLQRQQQPSTINGQENMANLTTIATTDNNNDSTMGVYNRFANRVLDVIIYLCAGLAIVDLLGMHVGFALKSIFGLGSFGTLVFSLASKDVAAEFVGGLMVQSSNFFDEGETVILQDGTTGTVAKIGWLHTYILKDDDYIVRVPNSQISHQRIARAKRTFNTSPNSNANPNQKRSFHSRRF